MRHQTADLGLQAVEEVVARDADTDPAERSAGADRREPDGLPRDPAVHDGGIAYGVADRSGMIEAE
jgi:hypothetical protein